MDAENEDYYIIITFIYQSVTEDEKKELFEKRRDALQKRVDMILEWEPNDEDVTEEDEENEESGLGELRRAG